MNWKIWLIVPLLAVLAYLTVLRIGFLSDDFVLLNQSAARGLDLTVFTPSRDWIFYRPVGLVLTWQLGWLFWGFNPFPFHLLGLFAHAVASLILGLWLSEFTSVPAMGWLAGALFAVFPLDTEAVGWVAAQWDVLAVMFVLLSLWLFTLWWRRPKGASTYLLSIVCFSLAVFSKESVFTFLPIFFLSAALSASSEFRIKVWAKLFIILLPFGAVLLANLALRLLFLGSIGGYTTVSNNYGDIAWGATVKYAGILLSPINSEVLPTSLAKGLGTVIPILILSAVLLTTRNWWRVLLVSFMWTALSFVPVLNLYSTSVNSSDLEGNRYFYLGTAGYCVGLGLLSYSMIDWASSPSSGIW